MGLRVKITGMHGYIGTLLSQALTAKGYEVSSIPREILEIDNHQLAIELRACDVVINLAGASILQRWTRPNRNKIYNSRVYTTLALTNAIKKSKPNQRPSKFINASAVGLYKVNKTHSETSTMYDEGFLGKVVLNWEKALKMLPKETECTIFRLGTVLGKDSPMLKKVIPLFKSGFGSKIGTGTQPFPFIHQDDVVKAFTMAVEGQLKPKTYNLVAPQQITNNDFTEAINKSVKRNRKWQIPAFLVQLSFGKSSTVLLNGSYIIPKNLIDSNYEFSYPDIDNCLQQIAKD